MNSAEQQVTYNQKQLDIMHSALTLFAEHGYDNTSVRDIASHAKVNIAMISYYFGSKEKLLEAIFENRVHIIRNMLTDVLYKQNLDPFQKMDLIIDSYIDTIMENRHFHVLMIREQVVLKNTVLYDVIKRMKDKNSKLLNSAIRAGTRAGYFRKNIDTYMLAMTLFGTINHTFNNRKYLCDEYNIDEKDDIAFKKTILNRLKNHVKLLYKSYLAIPETKKIN